MLGRHLISSGGPLPGRSPPAAPAVAYKGYQKGDRLVTVGRGHSDTRRVLTRSQRAPRPPEAEDGYRVLARVRKALAAQRAGGPVFQPDVAERRILEWLAFEFGADLEMDRAPRFQRAFQVLAKRPRVLAAIVDPGSTVQGLGYPLKLGDVVVLLQKSGLDVDANAVRRLSDSFGVPRLGGSERRTFFARHVLQVASAKLLDMPAAQVADLKRHLMLDLNEKERVLATMLSAVPSDQRTSLARSRTPGPRLIA